jgi:hypothetical protein
MIDTSNMTGGFAFDCSWWDLSAQRETAWRWAGSKNRPNGKLPQLFSTMLVSNKDAGRLTHRMDFQVQMKETKRITSFLILKTFPFSAIMAFHLNRN